MSHASRVYQGAMSRPLLFRVSPEILLVEFCFLTFFFLVVSKAAALLLAVLVHFVAMACCAADPECFWVYVRAADERRYYGPF
jgi:type IV secretory pathway VirB3-like protein